MIVKIKLYFQMWPNKCELTKTSTRMELSMEPKKNQQTPTHSIKYKREYEQRQHFFLTICKKVYSVWDTHKTNSTSKLWITHTMRKKKKKIWKSEQIKENILLTAPTTKANKPSTRLIRNICIRCVLSFGFMIKWATTNQYSQTNFTTNEKLFILWTSGKKPANNTTQHNTTQPK